MWPFTKKIKQNLPSVPTQIAMAVKSVTLPESQPDWKLFAKKDAFWDNKAAFIEGYAASSIVYACVEKRAKLISSVPWYAARKLRDGTIEPLDMNHPLNVLLETPNPDQSLLEFMYVMSQNLDLSGNGYASIIRGGRDGQPIALWPLLPAYMKIKPGRVNLVDYYEYDQSGKKDRIDAKDMIQLRLPNPNDPIFGMPVLMGAGRATDIDRESGNWQKASMQNRSTGSLHIEVPEGTQPDEIEAIKHAIKEKHSGPANADNPFITSGKINHLSRTSQEMDFVNSRKAIWSEICAAFEMSLSNLGFTENVNLANAEAMDKTLWKNTIIPRLELIKRQLDNQLAKDYGADICVCYDTSKVDALQENLTEKLDNARKLWDMGFSVEAINKRLDMGFSEEDLPVDLEIEEPPVMEDEEVKSLLSVVGYGRK